MSDSDLDNLSKRLRVDDGDMVVTNTTDSERAGLALNTSSTHFALDSAQFHGVNHGGDPIEGRSRSLGFGFYTIPPSPPYPGPPSWTLECGMYPVDGPESENAELSMQSFTRSFISSTFPGGKKARTQDPHHPPEL